VNRAPGPGVQVLAGSNTLFVKTLDFQSKDLSTDLQISGMTMRNNVVYAENEPLQKPIEPKKCD